MKNYMQANRFLQKYGPDAFKIIAAYEEAQIFRQTSDMQIGTAITVYSSRH